MKAQQAMDLMKKTYNECGLKDYYSYGGATFQEMMFAVHFQSFFGMMTKKMTMKPRNNFKTFLNQNTDITELDIEKYFINILKKKNNDVYKGLVASGCNLAPVAKHDESIRILNLMFLEIALENNLFSYIEEYSPQSQQYLVIMLEGLALTDFIEGFGNQGMMIDSNMMALMFYVTATKTIENYIKNGAPDIDDEQWNALNGMIKEAEEMKKKGEFNNPLFKMVKM